MKLNTVHFEGLKDLLGFVLNIFYYIFMFIKAAFSITANRVNIVGKKEL